MFAERFISYTQSVEDVNGTVMGRVFKFALDIPGLNVISIAMQSMTTDRYRGTAFSGTHCRNQSPDTLTFNASTDTNSMIKGAAKSFLVTTGL
jgi:hypothetical protein